MPLKSAYKSNSTRHLYEFAEEINLASEIDSADSKAESGRDEA